MTAKVKICGLKSAAMIETAIEAGSDYIGLVLFPPSPRNLSVEDAAKLAAIARGKVKIVTLLVDADDALITRVVKEIAPDLLQLHGKEPLERVAEVRTRARIPIMKAISVETAADVAAGLAYLKAADLVLFDAKAPEGAIVPGGNGLAFDWRLLAKIKGSAGYMLAGGLTPGNVAAAIRLTGTPAVDVSSGVESSPGVKDAALIRAFIRAAKSAA